MRHALSAVAVVIVAAAVMVGPQAGATNQEPIKLTAPQTVTVEYPALVGNAPVAYQGAPGDNTPDSCSQLTYCDNIPIELSIPDSLKNSDTEDYFLRLKIEWENPAGNNLDTYLFNAPYAAPAGPIAAGATANMPETINLYRPDKAAYILVVLNRTGPNTGYTVTAAITIEPFGGAPDFGGVEEGAGGRTTTTTRPPANDDDDGFSFDPEPSSPTGSSPSGPTTGPPPAFADVERDDALSALARQRGGFEDSLAAPLVTLEEDEGPPPKPVSGATVALFGGLVPAAVVGGSVFWLRRKGGVGSTGF